MPHGYLPAAYHCFQNEVTLLLLIVSRYLTGMSFASSPSGGILPIHIKYMNSLDRINHHTICETAILSYMMIFYLHLWSLNHDPNWRARLIFVLFSWAYHKTYYIYMRLINVWWMNSTLLNILFSNVLVHLSPMQSYEAYDHFTPMKHKMMSIPVPWGEKLRNLTKQRM